MKLKKPSKKLIVAAACSLALVGAIGLVGCGGSQQSGSNGASGDKTVTVAAARNNALIMIIPFDVLRNSPLLYQKSALKWDMTLVVYYA